MRVYQDYGAFSGTVNASYIVFAKQNRRKKSLWLKKSRISN